MTDILLTKHITLNAVFLTMLLTKSGFLWTHRKTALSRSDFTPRSKQTTKHHKLRYYLSREAVLDPGTRCSRHRRHTPSVSALRSSADGDGCCYRGLLSRWPISICMHLLPGKQGISFARSISLQHHASFMIDLPNRLPMRLSQRRSMPRGDRVSHGHPICYLYVRPQRYMMTM
jgi:hypothetical protein